MGTAGGAVWWAVLATGEARSQQGLEGWVALESEPEDLLSLKGDL